MDITLTTPALLFPALSLLLLAYTNRFLALAALTRDLYARYADKEDEIIKEQLVSLQRRIRIIKNTQTFGVASFFGGVLCMIFLFAGFQIVATWTFGLSLVLMLISLALSIREVQLSIETLSLQLRNLDLGNK
ncbi:MAG: DUF2721 domain-containing protein [Ignavibacteriales bacterium]|nr:DUF2721 domain-containing protein [Ignavibacteriales bacterium]